MMRDDDLCSGIGFYVTVPKTLSQAGTGPETDEGRDTFKRSKREIHVGVSLFKV